VHDLGFTPRATSLAAFPGEMRQVVSASVTFGWRSPSARLLMLVSAVHGGFLMWAFYAWQPYFLELLGRDAVWLVGLVSSLIALSTIAGNAVVDYLTRFCGRRTTLLLWSSLVLSLASVGVGLVDSFAPAVSLLLVAIGATGVGAPVQQAYLHAVVPSSERATVVSFASLLGSAGGIAGQLGLGYVSRAQSVGAGYVTGGLAMLLALPPLLLLRGRHDDADVIVGRRAGVTGPCAAQGLPEVSSVDTIARQPVVGLSGRG
jgi:hypothetical protein